MKRQGMFRTVIVAALCAVFLASLTGVALAHSWSVDDSCGTANRGTTYFYLGGPLGYWNTHTGRGTNNCHMWTTTISETASDPVNYAAYYLPTGSNYDHTNYNFFIWTYGGCDDHFRAGDTRYRRYRDGSGGGVTETYRVNQNQGCPIAIDATGSDVDAWYGTQGGQTRLIDKSTSPIGTKIGADNVQWSQ